MRKNRRKTLAAVWVLLILTLGFIWGNSLLGSEESAAVSNGMLDFVRPVLHFMGINLESDHLLRKLAHFAEFGAFGAELTALAALKEKLRFSCSLQNAGIALLSAAIDEGIQHYTGRFSSLCDVLLDLSGAVAGIIALSVIIYLFRKGKAA